MGQIVVTWPEIVVVGALWLLGALTALIFGMWRIEANTKVMREVHEFIRQRSAPRETVESDDHSAPPISLVRPKISMTYSPEDVGQALDLVRETHGQTRSEAKGAAPAIELSVIDDDLDSDLDDETRFDTHDLVAAARAAGVWHDNDDDCDDDRETREFHGVGRSLEVLRHVDENALHKLEGSNGF